MPNTPVFANALDIVSVVYSAIKINIKHFTRDSPGILCCFGNAQNTTFLCRYFLSIILPGKTVVV